MSATRWKDKYTNRNKYLFPHWLALTGVMFKRIGARRMLTYDMARRQLVGPRPLLMRLTALTWGCLILAGLLLGVAIFAWVNTFVAEAVDAPAATNAVPAQATQATAAIVVTSQRLTAVSVQNQSPQPALPAEAAHESLVIDPALDREGDVAARLSGKTPPQIAEEIGTQVKQYYSFIKDMTLPMYLAQRNTVLPLFFAGEPLKQLQDDFAARNQYTRYTAGNVVVKVDRLSPSGSVAVVRIVQKDWATETIDVQSGALLSQDKNPGDVTLIAQVQRTADNRWRIVEILNP